MCPRSRSESGGGAWALTIDRIKTAGGLNGDFGRFAQGSEGEGVTGGDSLGRPAVFDLPGFVGFGELGQDSIILDGINGMYGIF